MKKTTILVAGLALASGAALAGDDYKDKDFSEVDTDGDGQISRTEILKDPDEVIIADTFVQVDTDRDGYLNQEEYQALQDELQASDEEEAEE